MMLPEWIITKESSEKDHVDDRFLLKIFSLVCPINILIKNMFAATILPLPYLFFALLSMDSKRD